MTTKTLYTSRGVAVLVDPEDYEKYKHLKLWISTTGYAHFSAGYRNHKLHRILLGVKDKKVCVDHINGNPLDNRRSNLRLATMRQNIGNSKPRIKASCPFPYKGVGYRKARNCFRAYIKGVEYVTLLHHENVHLCAYTYNLAAKLVFGDYARLNQIVKLPSRKEREFAEKRVAEKRHSLVGGN